MIFKKTDLIEPLLTEGRLQIIFSGKGHPLDDEGKDIVAELVAMTKKYPGRVVFLENYDMEIARYMTQGCDVWLNNPRRPLEASGTSGMKAAINGVLNLSVLDGWWQEACIHGINGWQFGGGFEGKNQDAHDLKALYQVLLNEVIPTYYDHRAQWEKMMEASIKTVIEKFSAGRVLRDYYRQMYDYKVPEKE